MQEALHLGELGVGWDLGILLGNRVYPESPFRLGHVEDILVAQILLREEFDPRLQRLAELTIHLLVAAGGLTACDLAREGKESKSGDGVHRREGRRTGAKDWRSSGGGVRGWWMTREGRSGRSPPGVESRRTLGGRGRRERLPPTKLGRTQRYTRPREGGPSPQRLPTEGRAYRPWAAGMPAAAGRQLVCPRMGAALVVRGGWN